MEPKLAQYGYCGVHQFLGFRFVPELRRLFGKELGFALTEAIALFALVIAMLILFVF